MSLSHEGGRLEELYIEKLRRVVMLDARKLLWIWGSSPLMAHVGDNVECEAYKKPNPRRRGVGACCYKRLVNFSP